MYYAYASSWAGATLFMRTIQGLSLRFSATMLGFVVKRVCIGWVKRRLCPAWTQQAGYTYLCSSFVLFIPAILHFAAVHSGLTSLVVVLAVACSSSSMVKKFLPKKFLQQNAEQFAKASQEASIAPNNHSLGTSGVPKSDDADDDGT